MTLQKHNVLITLSTCGTSVLTNGASAADRALLTALANAQEKDLSQEDARRVNALKEQRCAALLGADINVQRKMSAELNGLYSVLERWNAPAVSHILLHTDTALGSLCASLIDRVLKSNGTTSVEMASVPGLRTSNLKDFRFALSDLAKYLNDRLDDEVRKRAFVVFNLTGGFKSINAYLQAVGMYFADRCVFQFESSHELMELPRLYVEIADERAIRESLSILRKLSVQYPVKGEGDLPGYDSQLLFEMDGELATTPWGEILWMKHRKKLLSEKVEKPLSLHLVISGAVAKQFNDVKDMEQRYRVNCALDHLSAYLDYGVECPRAYQFKEIKGTPMGRSTHEMYLWSDGATGRLYGHFESHNFIADTIGDHL